MKMFQDRINFSIYTKLLILFILVIVPVYAVGMLINISSKNAAKEDILRYMDMQAQYFIETRDRELEQTVYLQKEFSNNPDLLRLSEGSINGNYAYYSSMDKIRTQLSIVKNTSDLIEDVEVNIPQIGKSISVIHQVNDLDRQEFDKIKYEFSHNYSRILKWRDNLLLNIYYPYVAEDEAPLYGFSIKLSVNKVEKALDMVSEYDAKAFIISRDYNWYVSNQKVDEETVKVLQEKIKGLKDTQKIPEVMELKGEKVLMTLRKSEFLDISYVMYIRQKEVYGVLDKYNRWLWAISMLSIVIIAIFSLWVHRMIEKPLLVFKRAFRTLETGNLEVSIQHKGNDEFKYLYDQFNKTVGNLKVLLQDVYEQKIQTQQAELKQLQYQINPHFLYNTLFIIYRLAKKQDYENILSLSQHLGEYYKTITRSASEEITLEREVNHTKDYVAVQNIRFEGRIKATVGGLPEQLAGVLVPKLILQPVIENAYEHGLKNKLENGLLQVEFIEDDQFFYITVEDNGDETDTRQLDEIKCKLENIKAGDEITGIINIHRRLQLKYGLDSGVTAVRGTLGGVKFILKIAKEEGGRNV